MQQRTKDSAGFTLIELVVVVAVIGILAAIAYPAYTEQVRKSRRSDAYIALSQLANSQEKFYLNCNSYTTFIGAGTAKVGNCEVADGSGLGFTKTTSSNNYYSLSITAANATGYTLVATATGVQAADTACPTLTLTSVGAKTPAACWK
ncbi:MAG: prepilin-type N-terminal cleavage/methylation domain-containing protein [Gammaproteobacteria bacterium]|nr:prepilin-type N-terminal cleavage/methylation domain-containing protein [Gammaproteobacteria bacterium]